MPAAVSAVARADRADEQAEQATVSANRRRAALLCLVPGAVVGVVAAAALAAVGLPLVGIVVLVVVTAGGAAVVWLGAPDRVLTSLRATPCTEDEHPRLHNLVEGLCATVGLERPAIAVVVSDVPNALALGRDPRSATLVVTSGLESALGLVELEGVLAHELVHIKRNDTVLSSVAVVVALPWALVRGTSAGADLVHTLVGRGREYSADQRAARIVRYPTGIGAALGAMAAADPAPGGWPPGPGARRPSPAGSGSIPWPGPGGTRTWRGTSTTPGCGRPHSPSDRPGSVAQTGGVARVGVARGAEGQVAVEGVVPQLPAGGRSAPPPPRG